MAKSDTSTGIKQSPDVARWHDRLAASGAELLAVSGRHAVARFGEVAAEYAHLREEVALVDDTDRAIVRIFGKRARSMLDGLFTNDLHRLEQGEAVYGFFLTPKGRPVAEARVVAPTGQSDLWLDVPPACLSGLLAHLRRMLPPIYAQFELAGRVARIGVAGPDSWEAMAAWPAGPGDRAADLPPLAALGSVETGAGDAWISLIRREQAAGPGFDLYLPADRVAETWDELERVVRRAGGGPAGREACEVDRIERGVPVFGADIGPDNLPQETGQEQRAISFSKGCYTGQEVVARIHYRGHVNRHLRGLRPQTADAAARRTNGPEQQGSHPPGPGSKQEAGEHASGEGLDPGQALYREGRAVGSVTSFAHSPRLGPIALGYVRREIEPGQRLATLPEARPSVLVVELPFT